MRRRRFKVKPVEMAAAHTVTETPIAEANEAIGDVRKSLVGRTFASVEAVCVVDGDRTYLGAVRIADLLRAEEGTIGQLVDRDYPSVGPGHDQEHVAAEALAKRATSVIVIDADRKVLGAIPAISLLEILRGEHVEDLHRVAGIQRENARTRNALEAPPLRRARHRLPWLLVGLVGSMLAAGLVSRFEQVLSAKLAVAYFVPTIVYLADAIGTQTESIAIRGLSLSRLSLSQMLFDELRTGLLIGFVLGSLAFFVVTFAYGDQRLALTVALAILVAGAAATSIGLLLPWLLQRLGSDPAFGSGPVATIIQDVLSIFIYFVLATWLC